MRARCLLDIADASPRNGGCCAGFPGGGFGHAKAFAAKGVTNAGFREVNAKWAKI